MGAWMTTGGFKPVLLGLLVVAIGGAYLLAPHAWRALANSRLAGVYYSEYFNTKIEMQLISADEERTYSTVITEHLTYTTSITRGHLVQSRMEDGEAIVIPTVDGQYIF